MEQQAKAGIVRGAGVQDRLDKKVGSEVESVPVGLGYGKASKALLRDKAARIHILAEKRSSRQGTSSGVNRPVLKLLEEGERDLAMLSEADWGDCCIDEQHAN